MPSAASAHSALGEARFERFDATSAELQLEYHISGLERDWQTARTLRWPKALPTSANRKSGSCGQRCWNWAKSLPNS